MNNLEKSIDEIEFGRTMLLEYKKPFDFKEILEFMRLRMIKGIELVDEDRYSRTFNINGIIGYIVVIDKPEKSALSLDVFCDDILVVREIYYKVRRMFDLDTDFENVKMSLSSDELLKKIINNKVVPRLPVAFDSYEFLIRAILGQQITVKAATTLASRIVEKADIKFESNIKGLNYIFPSIDILIKMSLEGLGITKTRVKTIKAVNQALIDEVFSLSINQSITKFYETFTSVKGIGDWTANYVAMRGLGMVDAFPAGDLGVIKAIEKEIANMSIKEIKLLSENWKPYRAYATLYLWQSLGED